MILPIYLGCSRKEDKVITVCLLPLLSQLTDPESASAHADPAGETLAGSVGLAVTHVDQVCRLVHREVAVGDDVSAADRPVLHREGTSLPSLRFGGCGAGCQVLVSQVGLDDG